MAKNKKNTGIDRNAKFLRLQYLFGELSMVQVERIKAQVEYFEQKVDELLEQEKVIKGQIMELL